MSWEELNETRPGLNDGNYLLELIKEGDLKEAWEESKRLRFRYARPNRAAQHRGEWVAWADRVRKYLKSLREVAA